MRDLISMLEYEAKRRPELKALLDKGDKLNKADVDAYQAPMPWFKKALVLFISRGGRRPGSWTHGTTPDYLGSTFSWTGPETFIQVSDRSSISIRTGDPVWVDPNGFYWIDTVKCELPPPEFVGYYGEECTKTRYQALVQENLQRRYAGMTDAPSVFQGPRFTISRG